MPPNQNRQYSDINRALSRTAVLNPGMSCLWMSRALLLRIARKVTNLRVTWTEPYNIDQRYEESSFLPLLACPPLLVLLSMIFGSWGWDAGWPTDEIPLRVFRQTRVCTWRNSKILKQSNSQMIFGATASKNWVLAHSFWCFVLLFIILIANVYIYIYISWF